MHVFDASFKRNTYQVELNASLLFEYALGIAAMTYPKLHDAMDKPASYWRQLREEASADLNRELDFCQKHQTWKMLLQLLHADSFASPGDVADRVFPMRDEDFNYMVLPYLGRGEEALRMQAAQGDKEAVDALIEACRVHAFFPDMIRAVSRYGASRLKHHLADLLRLWEKEIGEKDAAENKRILERDLAEKKAWLEKGSPEEVVLRAAGVEYKPEAGVSKVMLIPHVIYRPWTIEANMEDTQIYYYPVSDSNLNGDTDPYEPPGRLVQLYKALGDDKRLRALKLISEQSRSLKELTELLNTGKTNVHHHLAILRSAGLVRVQGGSYAWNPGSLDHHAKELRGFLGLEE
ncbi:helix-turn-helix domain-containing protein [Paenibacillus sp. VCA1]|uniref:ArsR/SmtB family transcription factor n=1 Tax=Paenibacillus sp. VCA1 TaxID=3039148 RepID=UPI00287204DC|nr:ArsR family transcriptional regulator [Paenibacillus sp. VCA1]MDR9855250.1 helix-turn-helix domain-containing protein [Paenibacillus sp. VCA1]